MDGDVDARVHLAHALLEGDGRLVIMMDGGAEHRAQPGLQGGMQFLADKLIGQEVRGRFVGQHAFVERIGELVRLSVDALMGQGEEVA